MPSVLPIKKSPVTKYLLKNKFRAEKANSNITKNGYLYFYGENNNYLGEMTVHHRGYFDVDVSKLIFKEKLKPIFREYTSVKTKMATFWDKENPDTDEYKPIAYTTTRVTIDLKNKTKTTQVIERVLEKEPILIKKIKEKYGTNIYELKNQTFKYKIKSVTNEKKPYVWGKYSKYSVFG